jgi:transcriptional regulator with XRE-family HTH domain
MTEVAISGETPSWTLTDRLRKAREHGVLQQAQLAALTGISERSIQNYEAGRTTPRRPQLIAWALATGVSLEWLEGDVRPKGLEPPTFWSGVWRETPTYSCARCGWPSWEWLCRDCADAVRTDDLALAA